MISKKYKEIFLVFLLYCVVSFLLGFVSPMVMYKIIGGGMDALGRAGILSTYVLYYMSIFYVWYYYDSRLLNKKVKKHVMILVILIPFVGLFMYFFMTRNIFMAIKSTVLFFAALFVLYFFDSVGAWMYINPITEIQEIQDTRK